MFAALKFFKVLLLLKIEQILAEVGTFRHIDEGESGSYWALKIEMRYLKIL